MNNNIFEIERKFLIMYPSEVLLSNVESSDIEQTYLRSSETSMGERLRKRTYSDRCEFTHTRKKRVTDIKRIEIESVISESEYNDLLNYKDRDRSVISKKRYCIPFKNHVIEIDIYPFWNDRAVMEIELSSENETYDIPESITVIKEITDDKRYTNASLAISIPYDDIIND